MSKPKLTEQRGEIPFSELGEYDCEDAGFRTEEGGIEYAFSASWGDWETATSLCACHHGEPDEPCTCTRVHVCKVGEQSGYVDGDPSFKAEPIELVIVRDDLEEGGGEG